MNHDLLDLILIVLLLASMAFGLVQFIRLRRASAREEHDFLGSILQVVGALVLVMDREGRILRFNEACEATSGYRFAEVHGHAPWEFLIPPEEQDSVRAVFAALVGGNFPNNHENEWLTKDGRRHTIDWFNTALTDRNGRVSHIIGTGIDVTEHKAALAALKASEETLRLHARELEELHAKLDAEQELAREIMDHITQRHNLGDTAIDFWQQPSSTFNGDILCLKRSPSGRLYVMLADATGHGLPAAVCLLPAVTIFYSMAKRDLPLGEMVEEINRQLYATLPTDHFLAAGLFMIDGSQCAVEWWLGGMPPVLVMDHAGHLVGRLVSDNLPLGIQAMDRPAIQTESFCSTGSHRYVLYTDGIVEAADGHGELYGEARLIAACEGLDNRLEAIKSDVLRHLGGRPADDDLSLVMLDCRQICRRTCDVAAPELAGR